MDNTQMSGLRTLLDSGALKPGDEVFFGSSGSLASAVVTVYSVKHLSGDAVGLKATNGDYLSVRGFVRACLGHAPSGHPLEYLVDKNGNSLWELVNETP